MADKTYRFELGGSGTGEGTLRNPYLKGVYDADGDFTPNSTSAWTSFTAP